MHINFFYILYFDCETKSKALKRLPFILRVEEKTWVTLRCFGYVGYISTPFILFAPHNSTILRWNPSKMDLVLYIVNQKSLLKTNRTVINKSLLSRIPKKSWEVLIVELGV